MDNNSELIIYTTEDGLTKVDVTFENDTVWLSLDQMSELFQRDKSTISRHIKNVFNEGELFRISTVANFATVQMEGDRQVERNIECYNLDVIISVGYRVKSKRGVQFRIWATNILKEYMKKGFAMDDERLKNLGGVGYFKELLERIRDIRASEKVFYRQVLEIYATSIDYDPKVEISIEFFKKVQNKIHYAVSGETAAEVIYHRADAEKEFMGLATFSGNQPTLQEARIAKNYLNEKELRAMGQYVMIMPWEKLKRNIRNIKPEQLVMPKKTTLKALNYLKKRARRNRQISISQAIGTSINLWRRKMKHEMIDVRTAHCKSWSIDSLQGTTKTDDRFSGRQVYQL